jgi:hypothetical protein
MQEERRREGKMLVKEITIQKQKKIKSKERAKKYKQG